MKYGRITCLVNGRNIETLKKDETLLEDFDLVGISLKDGGLIDFFPPKGCKQTQLKISFLSVNSGSLIFSLLKSKESFVQIEKSRLQKYNYRNVMKNIF